jgi:hypothetical protein
MPIAFAATFESTRYSTGSGGGRRVVVDRRRSRPAVRDPAEDVRARAVTEAQRDERAPEIVLSAQTDVEPGEILVEPREHLV